MRRVIFAVLLMALSAGTVLLGGCGGSGSTTQPSDKEGRIHEFRGLGYEGSKPGGLDLGKKSKLVGDKTVPAVLGVNQTPLDGAVAKGQTSFYRLPIFPSLRRVIITLQQLTQTDSDLYVLTATPWNMSLLGASGRYANYAGNPDAGDSGVPDWVYLELPATSPRAAGEVAIYGVDDSGAATKHFRLEMNTVNALAIGGDYEGSIAQHASAWFRFRATAGHSYSAHLLPGGGGSDPDIFIYDSNSAGFVGGNTDVGGGTVNFTATNNHWYYIRLYGFGTSNVYDLQVF